MNVGLLFFAALLIIAGAATGSVYIIFFGIVFLVAAVLPTQRRTKIPQRQPPPPAPAAPPARRAPPVTRMEKVAAEPPVPIPEPRTTQASQTPAIAPLFPSTVFPTLNPLPAVRYEATQEAKRGESPDEFLTLVALLGLLRLFSERR